MSALVEEQGEVIDVIGGHAEATAKDLETGYVSKLPLSLPLVIVFILYL